MKIEATTTENQSEAILKIFHGSRIGIGHS